MSKRRTKGEGKKLDEGRLGRRLEKVRYIDKGGKFCGTYTLFLSSAGCPPLPRPYRR